MLTISNLTKSFGTKVAVDIASYTIPQGTMLGLVGNNGAGKTTLLNMLGGMDNVTSGALVVADEDISKYNKRQLTNYRRNEVGFVFQFYNLMPNLTALENVELATEMKHRMLMLQNNTQLPKAFPKKRSL